jgi:hypothetical protein
MGTLSQLADQLVAQKVSINDSREKVRDVVSGPVRSVLGFGRQRVLPSTAQVEAELKELAAYINAHAVSESRKWAGALLMVQAQLEVGGPEAALSLVQQVIATPTSCPLAARPFATAMIDAVLDHSIALPRSAMDQLRIARNSFAHGKA